MATAAPVELIDIGRVISRGFEALRANFFPFFAIALLLSGVPAFVTQYLILSMMKPGDPSFILSPLYWGALTGGALVAVIAGALLQGVLVRSTILFLSGRDPDLSNSAMLALRLVLPIIGISIVVGVLTGIGLLLLIVPGIIIYCAFSVSVPALVEERRGVFGSMQRSRDLTRGSRGRIFILLIVFWVFSAIISGVFNAIAGITPMGSLTTLPNPILAGSMGALGSALTSVIVAVSLAALYVELRTVKEGATTDDLASIFA